MENRTPQESCAAPRRGFFVETSGPARYARVARQRCASPAWAEKCTCLRECPEQPPGCSCGRCENFLLTPCRHNSSPDSPSLKLSLIFHEKERECSLTRRGAKSKTTSHDPERVPRRALSLFPRRTFLLQLLSPVQHDTDFRTCLLTGVQK